MCLSLVLEVSTKCYLWDPCVVGTLLVGVLVYSALACCELEFSSGTSVYSESESCEYACVGEW